MKVNQNPLSGNPLVDKSVSDKAKVDKSKEAGRAADVQKAKVAPNSEGAKTHSAGAQVDISEQAQLMRKAAEAVHAAPDVRQDRVAQLKERIRAGTYKVDSQSVADKLVEEHFLNDFGKNNV